MLFTSPPLPVFLPYGLVSLWEIMTQLKAEAIMRGLIVLAEMRRKWTLEAARRQPFVQHQFEFAVRCFQELADALETSGLPIAAKHARGLLSAFNDAATEPNGDRLIEGKSFSYSTHHLDRLLAVVAEEAGERIFISLPAQSAIFYQQATPLMGENVEDAFLDASYDIAEAGKCLGLDRNTAAVFHMMRAMEIAVRVVGQKIGATVLNEHGEILVWGVILANVKRKVNAMPRGAEQDEWYKVHALLHSVNRAFRTKAAHPAHKYTAKEAENAFNATKAFMQELAERSRETEGRDGEDEG